MLVCYLATVSLSNECRNNLTAKLANNYLCAIKSREKVFLLVALRWFCARFARLCWCAV